VAPSTVDRSANGDVIGFNFTAPVGVAPGRIPNAVAVVPGAHAVEVQALIGLHLDLSVLALGRRRLHDPGVYKAEAVILVDSQKVPERYVASTANADVQDRLATISQQILATSRLQKIIDTYHLYQREKTRLPQEEIIEMMRKDTKISLERGWSQDRTSAFRIAYQGRDPATVADVANQIGNLFIEENLRTRENHAEGPPSSSKSSCSRPKKR
jgi:hypothetical protein